MNDGWPRDELPPTDPDDLPYDGAYVNTTVFSDAEKIRFLKANVANLRAMLRYIDIELSAIIADTPNARELRRRIRTIRRELIAPMLR